MNELRAIFPIHIVRGALLRPDGIAVGLVVGGAPSWDLLSVAARAQAGSDYHRLLLALDAPLDVYLIEQPPDVEEEIAALIERQERASHALLATILGEMADYLAGLNHLSNSRNRQVVWAIATGADASARVVGGLVGTLRKAPLPGQNASAKAAGPTPVSLAALAQASEKARRLAEALEQLGGAPPPRLPEAEEIARIVYRLADPVREQRYPLAGTLLDRVRRLVTNNTWEHSV